MNEREDESLSYNYITEPIDNLKCIQSSSGLQEIIFRRKNILIFCRKDK